MVGTVIPVIEGCLYLMKLNGAVKFFTASTRSEAWDAFWFQAECLAMAQGCEVPA